MIMVQVMLELHWAAAKDYFCWQLLLFDHLVQENVLVLSNQQPQT